MPNKGNITRYSLGLTMSDVIILNAGIQVKTDHSFGPEAQDYHVLHYITSGSGTLQIGGNTFALKKGDLFYLPQKVDCFYCADKNDPYQYYWVAFKGNYVGELLHGAALSAQQPVLHVESKILKRAFAENFRLLKEPKAESSLRVLSNFYLIFSILLKESNRAEENEKIDYVINRSLDYIAENYEQPITVTDVCKRLRVNRTFFSEQFKKTMRVSPKDYISNLKLTKAAALLTEGKMSIEMVASSIGMSHVAFCKLFKSRMLFTPMQYKKAQRGEKKIEHNNMHGEIDGVPFSKR